VTAIGQTVSVARTWLSLFTETSVTQSTHLSLSRHICHSAISSLGTCYSDNCQSNHWQPCRAQVKNVQAVHLHYPRIIFTVQITRWMKPLKIGHQEHLQAALCQSRSEALTVVLLRIQPFCDVMSCHWVTDPWWFERQWLTAYPWRQGHHDPLEWCEPLTQWHSITSQKTWTISSMLDFKMRLKEYRVKSFKLALPIMEVSLLRKHVLH
jgi:hypothetical protein